MTRLRLAIQAGLYYVIDGEAEGNPPYCAEMGLSTSEPEIQGWGPDALAAALDLACNTYEALVQTRQHFARKHGDIGGENCPECSKYIRESLRDAR